MVNVRSFVQLMTVAAALCVAPTAATADARMLQSTDASTADESAAPVTRVPSPTRTPVPTTEAPTDAPSPTPVLPIDLSLTLAPEPTTVAPTPEPTTVAPTPEPSTAAPEPSTAAPEPSTAAPEPSTSAPVPSTAAPEPTLVAPTPSTAAPEPSTAAPEPSTAAPEPSTAAPLPPITVLPVPEPTTLAPVPEPTTAPPAPPTVTPAPGPEPTTAPPAPTTATPAPGPEPTTAPPGPTTVTPAPGPEPTTAPPGPTTVTPAPGPEPTTAPPGPTTVTPAPGPAPTTPAPTDTPKPTTVAPPLVDVSVATEAPDTPAPSVTKKGEDAKETKEPEVNSQANMKDIIVASTNDTASDSTTAPKVNPFEIREINTDAPKPVVLDIKDESTSTAEPKLYVRGAKTDPPGVIDGTSSGTVSGNGASSSTSASSPSSATNVIGGSHRNTATSAEAILSTSSQAFHDFLRYATCAFAGISVALLLFFHYVSLDATLTWTSSLWSPNTWEFILYVSYLQQMGTVSQLTLLKTPYFLWDYTDSFAWTNFLIERATTSDSRRLETIVLGGVVAYGDRIGIDETSIVYHAVVGFAVVLAVLLLAFLVIAVLAKRKAEQALDDPANMHSSTQGVHQLRSASIRTLGLCVLIWYFALYPLSTYASFEISMEVQSKETVPLALLVSILAIGVVCFGVLAWCGRVIMHKSKDELLQFENMATWGSLYAEFSFRSRMFFILGALVQIVTGIIVGTMDADPTQLIIVILIEVLYLVAVFVLNPFAEVLVLRFTYVLGLLKIVNFALSFGFLNSNGMSDTGRNGVANAYIGVNTLVIIFWFIRLLIVFSTYIRAWAVRSSFVEEHGLEDSTAKYETRTATDSEVYASVTTARHGDGGPGSSDDDYHNAPAPRDLGYL